MIIYNGRKNFEDAIAFIMKWEVGSKPNGGYTNDPRDPGGETKYGISKRAYPDINIKNLTLGDAEVIYYNDYWKKCNCQSMTSALALIVFDSAVNQGAPTAAKLLQRTIKTKPDGIIGPKTIERTRLWNTENLIEKFASRRAMRYCAANRIKLYGPGWFNRLMDAVTESVKIL